MQPSTSSEWRDDKDVASHMTRGVYAQGGECAGGGLLYDGRCILASLRLCNH
jgi:hypothetical protein